MKAKSEPLKVCIMQPGELSDDPGRVCFSLIYLRAYPAPASYSEQVFNG